jgi:hypothetical protein
MLHFNKHYFLIALLLLLIEIFIAVFFRDGFIRHNVGDFLVVILIYCFIRTFINGSVLATAIFVFLFAIAVEAAQYFNLATKLGLEHNRLAKIFMGNSFDWADIICYGLGILFVLMIEYKSNRE